MVTERFTDEANPLASWRGCCLTLGNFDGVHLGHSALLGHLKKMATRLGVPAVAMTFHPHPVTVLTGQPVPFVQTLEDRVEGLLARGADGVWVYPFSKTFSTLTPREFVECILVHALAVKGVVIGPDFRFGARRAGTPELLQQMGKELGFEVELLTETVLIGGEPASSSRIRSLLAVGDMESVEAVSGSPYRIHGEVRHGAGLGHTLGFPTANIVPPKGLILPPAGVYAAEVYLDNGTRLISAVSLGFRPTFDDGPLILEAHILDFDSDLYGALLDVRLRHLVRLEKRFDSIDNLIDAMNADLSLVRAWFALQA